MAELIKLTERLRYKGFDYSLTARTDNIALYRQMDEDIIVGYEVFKIYIRGGRYSQYCGRVIPPKERFPNDESFGYSAWSFCRYENAIRKFEELIN